MSKFLYSIVSPMNNKTSSLGSFCLRNYLIANGFVGDPTAPVIGIAGATNINS